MIAVHEQNGATPKSPDDEGAIGIGTMIVFIAMVIVAAVAAAVLINTAGTLQRKSGETGQETTEEVSGNIFVRDIIGNISDTADDGTDAVENVTWYVSLAPGAEPIDMENMVIRWEHDQNLSDLTFNETDGECNELEDGFCVSGIQDVGDDTASVLSEGDIATIDIGLHDGQDQEMLTRESADALLIPEKGTPINAGFKTPATFGQKSNISLK